MTKEEVTMIGFEIVAYAGDARSKFLEALTAAQKGEFENAEKLVKEGEECIVQAHNSQTDMLAKEAAGEDVEIGLIMIHGQDHLMTTILLKDIIKHMIELYRRGV